MKVNKKKPNILDKALAKKPVSKDTSLSPPTSPLSATNSAIAARVEELTSELHKLKQIILKHEIRIRDMEKRVDGKDNNNSHLNANNGDGLLPDEV